MNLVGGPRKGRKGQDGSSSRMTENEFLINHYAGSVKYDVRGFLDKNKDELVSNLQDVMKTSKDPFISDVLFPSTNGSSDRRGKSKKRISRTSISQAIKALDVHIKFQSTPLHTMH